MTLDGQCTAAEAERSALREASGMNCLVQHSTPTCVYLEFLADMYMYIYIYIHIYLFIFCIYCG